MVRGKAKIVKSVEIMKECEQQCCKAADLTSILSGPTSIYTLQFKLVPSRLELYNPPTVTRHYFWEMSLAQRGRRGPPPPGEVKANL